MDKYYFFNKYAIDERRFAELGLSWDELMRIYEDYGKRLPVYEDTARFLAEILNKEAAIHSIKYRVKDKEHLIEKIIRKSSLEPAAEPFTVRNYRRTIKDLIGLRALHLFKENWVDIHRFLADNWDFYTTPKANYKKGDPETLLDLYTHLGCELNEHRHGYRSIHYHLRVRPGRHELVAEVQVRTLFEEAWSEIDHYFRYSLKREDEQAEPYLGILNNITSNADALASYINQLETFSRDAAGVGDAAPEAGGAAPGDAGPGGAGPGGAEPVPQQLKVRDIYKKVRYG
ncbi:MAG: RelA/SpoT domain-containing protein [Clostridiales bacterium]|jgi:ppGpp synthetase/RelA/SpoT-type nucleotidyltranferase|nr:RelA/SpoT domain-containing protein [Clostridiales bacterium]